MRQEFSGTEEEVTRRVYTKLLFCVIRDTILVAPILTTTTRGGSHVRGHVRIRLPFQRGGPRAVLARRRRRRGLGEPTHPRTRRLRRTPLPVVPGRGAQHVRQRRGPSRGRGARGTHGIDLRLRRAGHPGTHHVRAVAGARGPLRRCARRPGCDQGGPGTALHAHDRGVPDRDARVRATGCGALRRVRGFRPQGTGEPDRRLRPGGRRHRVRWRGAQAPDRVPARDRGGPAVERPRAVGGARARTGRFRHDRGPGARAGRRRRARVAVVDRGAGRRDARGARDGQGHRPALHPLHLRHHGHPPRAWCGTTADTRWP